MAPEIVVFNPDGTMVWCGPQRNLGRFLSDSLCPHYVCVGQGIDGELAWHSCALCALHGVLFTRVRE